MLEPLQQWYCDVCGEVIERPADGYVLWGSDADNLEHGFTIIHQGRCDRNQLPASMELSDLLGEFGVTKLLAFLSHGALVADQDHHRNANRVRDFDEFVDFFRRVQVPYYEEARTLFSDPDVREHFAGANEVAPYMPDTLRFVIENYPRS